MNWHGLLQGTRFNSENISDLLAANPNAVSPILGYHLVKGYFPASDLFAGEVLNTTSTVKQFNVEDQVLTLSVDPSLTQVRSNALNVHPFSDCTCFRGTLLLMVVEMHTWSPDWKHVFTIVIIIINLIAGIFLRDCQQISTVSN
jgi:hypothetical protein